MSQRERKGLTSEPPPEAWMPALRVMRLATRPLEKFLQIEAASGILLIATAAIALLWASSPYAPSYEALCNYTLGVTIGGETYERSMQWVVNDLLMAVFFFVVGMEIRREIHHGELSEVRRATLPIAAALGGMLVPAGLYFAVARDSTAIDGWGVPMATDIAFALGVLTLLGPRVPAALRVLLLALAVIDDLGAILVIALFYSGGIELGGLAVASIGVVLILGMQKVGVRLAWLYIFPGAVVWVGAYSAGVHPTIAGVAIGLLTPVRAWLGRDGLLDELSTRLGELERVSTPGSDPHALARALRTVAVVRREAISPAERLIDLLHPWVAFGIMPVFALVNAGVALQGIDLGADNGIAALGITVGLLVGKPLGIVLACSLSVRAGIATLPRGIERAHLAVLGIVSGIGFTMSLFIAQLAFRNAAMLSAGR
jgi:NhaA family Na+:H+ antiporter